MTGIIITMEKSELQQLIHEAVRAGIDYWERQREEEKAARGENRFLKVKEAAGFLKVSVQKVRVLTMKKAIPHIKQGRSVYYVQDELEQWLESQRVGDEAEQHEQYEQALKSFYAQNRKK